MTAVGAEFHPDFSSNGDVVLQSKDGTNFRLESAVLRAASSVFQDMFSFPRDPDEAADAPIALAEGKTVLAFIFNSVFPTASSTKLHSYNEIWRVLETAEKYDIPCVEKRLRDTILADTGFRKDAVNLFALASQYGWRDVVRWSSNDSLKENIFCSEKMRILHQRANTDDANALREMHADRKKVLWKAVQEAGEQFSENEAQIGPLFYSCKGCQYPIVEGANESVIAVEVFRSCVENYINKCPDAQELSKPEFWERKIGGVAVLKCRNCNSNIFDVDAFIREVERKNANADLPYEIW